jgi:hypothetical protein
MLHLLPDDVLFGVADCLSQHRSVPTCDGERGLPAPRLLALVGRRTARLMSGRHLCVLTSRSDMTAANLVLPTAAALARVRYLVIRYAAHVEVAWVRWLVLSAGVDLRRLTVCCDVNASRILVTALCDTLGRTTVRDFRAPCPGVYRGDPAPAPCAT